MKPGVRRLIEDLRGARVLVIHPRDAEGEALIDQLKRIGCNVRGVWPPPPVIPNTRSPTASARALAATFAPIAATTPANSMPGISAGTPGGAG